MDTIAHNNETTRESRFCTAGWLGVLAVLAFSVITAVSLPGCRTTEGLGRDVEHLGDNIADSADKHKPD